MKGVCLPSAALTIIASPEPQSPLWSSRCNNPSLRTGVLRVGVPTSATAPQPVNCWKCSFSDPRTGTLGVGPVMGLCLQSPTGNASATQV